MPLALAFTAGQVRGRIGQVPADVSTPDPHSADSADSSADTCGPIGGLFPQVSARIGLGSADSADTCATCLLANREVTLPRHKEVPIGTRLCRGAANVGTADPVGTGGTS